MSTISDAFKSVGALGVFEEDAFKTQKWRKNGSLSRLSVAAFVNSIAADVFSEPRPRFGVLSSRLTGFHPVDVYV